MKSEQKKSAHPFDPQRLLNATSRQKQHAPGVWAFAPIAAAVFLSIQAMDAASQPAGGQVKAGQASIQQNASNTQIRQTSQNAIIDWRNFNVAKDHSVIFNVPQSSNATLNRVTSNSPSTIYGSVHSNGRVFLINQAGVLIDPSGVIQTAGFTASTRDVDNASFMNGQALHFKGQSNGEVVNLGTIRSSNGDVMLIGSRVVNAGHITTPQGQTVLAAGDSVFVATSPFSQVVVEGVAAQGGVTNSGLIEAAQAKLLAAGSTYAMAVRNTGTIEAMGHELARALVKIDAPSVVLSGVISAQNNGPVGEPQTGGQIHVSGQRIALQNAQIAANGSQGGGQVLIGGAWQGANPEVLAHAKNVSMDQRSRISANATTLGAGGEVVLWSQGKTDFSGRIEANAGPSGGNGGRIEVSGRQVIFEGITSTQAPKGKRGVTLVDPDDVCIANDQAACAATDTYFNSSTLMFNLDLGDVTVNNNAALTTGNGDIKIKSYIFDNDDRNGNQGKLSLIAARDIIGAEAGMTMLYDLDMNAGRDVILTGITQSSRGRIDISAGRDFKLGMPFESSSLRTGVGVGDSTLQTLNVQAGNNILIGVGATDYGFNNISGAGAVTLQAGNSLTLQTKPDTTQVPVRANTAGAASSTALTIKTGSFTNQFGSNAFSGVNGNWLVYSGSPSTDTRGGVVANFRQFSAPFGTSQLTAGNGFFYSENLAPVTAQLSGAASKTYDGSAATSMAGLSVTASGASNGDTLIVGAGSAAVFADKNVGSGKLVTVSPGFLSATNGSEQVFGYSFANPNGASAAIGSITPRSLNAQFSSVSKVYDGTRTGQLNNLVDDRIPGDNVALSLAPQFADKNVGNNIAVTFSNPSIQGADVQNYVLAPIAATTGSITPRPLNISLAAQDKVYDGTLTAPVNRLGDDRISGDDVVVNVTPLFASKNVGNSIAVTYTNPSVQGMDAQNYLVAPIAASKANITPRPLTITLAAQDKVYNGTRSAQVNQLKDDRIAGDDVTAILESQFADKNAGTAKAITVTRDPRVYGADAANYRIPSSYQTTANITSRRVFVTYQGIDKVYDGNNQARVTHVFSSGGDTKSGVIGGDDLELFSRANFSSSSASSNLEVVNITQASLTGNDKGNYGLVTLNTSGNGQGRAFAKITPRPFQAAFTGVNRQYDGSTQVSVKDTSNQALSALPARFESQHELQDRLLQEAADQKAVQAAGGFFISSAFIGDRGSVQQLPSGQIAGDAVSATYLQATLDNKNAGSNKPVNVSGVSLTGQQRDNYVLANNTAQTTANVDRRNITVTANDAVGREGLPEPVITYTVGAGALVGSETLTGNIERNKTTNGVYGTFTMNTGSLTNANNPNYNITLVTGLVTLQPDPARFDGSYKGGIYRDNFESRLTGDDYSGGMQTFNNIDISRKWFTEQTQLPVYVRPLAELTAIYQSAQWRKLLNPLGIAECTSPPQPQACLVYPTARNTGRKDEFGNALYTLDPMDMALRSNEWSEAVRPAQTTSRQGGARDFSAPETRPATLTGLPEAMKGYEAKLTLTWLQMNSRDATAQNLAFIKQYLREGTDFTLDNSTTPATIAYKDTKRVREYAQAQFEARDERDFKIVNGQRVEYGSMRATEATAQANRNQLLGVLMSDASKAFTVKPENRTVEQQELVNFMYSYIAKEAKDAYDTARNEYTAWKNQNPIKEVATYESNNMMLLFGNLTGNQDGYVYSAPPTHLISQAQSGVNFDGINAQALAQGLEGAAITLEKVSTAFSINSTNAALNSTLKITLGSVDDLADGFISAVDDMKNIQKAAEQILKTAKISRLVGGGVVTLVTTLITSAIEGIVTNVVNKSETERLATYFDKKGPDMSWLNDFSSLDPAKREAAQTKMMLYSAKMMTSY